MLTPSPVIIPAVVTQLLAPFRTIMTAPTLANGEVLVCGGILAPGCRTITAALRAMGLVDEKGFTRYHRFFNRATYAALLMSQVLLVILVTLFLSVGAEILIVFDASIERRYGPEVHYKGFYRDAVHSTKKHVVLTSGIQWLCAALVVIVPWSSRRWALPFLCVPVRSQKVCEHEKRKYIGCIEWTIAIIKRVRRWFPAREITVTADGGFAATELLRACQSFERPVRMVCRVRMDARLFDPAPEQPKGKRGPKPKKGKRQPKLSERLKDSQTAWEKATVRWYDGQDKELEVASGTALWQTPGEDPLAVRWMLVKCDEDEKFEPGAYLCSDTEVTVAQMLEWTIARWGIEVTFEEARKHLGWGTQRHWSNRAVGRVTPCLLGLFSLVVCLAKKLYPQTLPIQAAAWYDKKEATFSDVLAAVRAHLWGVEEYLHVEYPAEEYLHEILLSEQSSSDDCFSEQFLPQKYLNSTPPGVMCLIPKALLSRLHTAVCYAA